jgi:hypothetical protein
MALLPATILAYLGLLSLLATASPGHGLLGRVLLALPTQVLDCLHIPAYGLLAWIGIAGLQQRGWPLSSAAAASSLFALAFGLWTETLQLSVPGRGLEFKDLVSDGIGVAAAGIAAGWRSTPAPSTREIQSGHFVTTSEDSA